VIRVLYCESPSAKTASVPRPGVWFPSDDSNSRGDLGEQREGDAGVWRARRSAWGMAKIEKMRSAVGDRKREIGVSREGGAETAGGLWLMDGV
jgi:hypothetical protein